MYISLLICTYIQTVQPIASTILYCRCHPPPPRKNKLLRRRPSNKMILNTTEILLGVELNPLGESNIKLVRRPRNHRPKLHHGEIPARAGIRPREEGHVRVTIDDEVRSGEPPFWKELFCVDEVAFVWKQPSAIYSLSFTFFFLMGCAYPVQADTSVSTQSYCPECTRRLSSSPPGAFLAASRKIPTGAGADTR